MTERPDDAAYAAINAVLAQIASSSYTQLSWYAAWQSLGAESSEEQVLDVYRSIRDAGLVPEEGGFFLVSWQIDAITDQRAEEVLRPYEDRLTAIERAHGLAEDEYWARGEEPPEYEDTRRQLHDRWDSGVPLGRASFIQRRPFVETRARFFDSVSCPKTSTTKPPVTPRNSTPLCFTLLLFRDRFNTRRRCVTSDSPCSVTISCLPAFDECANEFGVCDSVPLR